MKEDLTTVGFEQLITSSDVDAALSSDIGTVLVVVNSVCGCAAGNARPAVKMAIQNGKRPNKLTTVFAGVDTDATECARSYMIPYPPSSPSIALFKKGKLIHFVERHQIESASVEMIAENLIAIFDEFC